MKRRIPSPKPIERLMDNDPAALAPLPVLLDGDVIRLATIQRVHRKAVLSARAAASAALGAGACAGPKAMSLMRIEKHWRPGGRDVVVIPDAIERPMPLLPFVRYAVTQYLKLLGDPTEGPLFVEVDGKPAERGTLRVSLVNTAKVFGVRGDRMFGNLHAFFERQLVAEPDQRAVDYMTGCMTHTNPERATCDPEDFPDVDYLMQILLTRHALAGPATTYFGPSARFVDEAPGNLPARVHRRKLSQAMTTDEIVRDLAATPWPPKEANTERKKLRSELQRRHIDHLHALWCRHELKLTEIAWLWRLPTGVGHAWKIMMRYIPPGVPTVERPAAELRPLLVAHWRIRPDGESILNFALRMVGEIGLSSISAVGFQLRIAGELGKRRRGRPRKNRRSA